MYGRKKEGTIPYFCGFGKGLRQNAKGSNCVGTEETKCARTTYNTGDGMYVNSRSKEF